MMKSFIQIVILLVGLASSTANGQPLLVSENSLSGLSLSYHPGTPAIDTLSIDNDVSYSRYNYDDHTLPDTPGRPMIPYHVVYFGSPSGSIPQVSVNGVAPLSESPVRLLPIPNMAADSHGNAIESFSEDIASYAMSGRQPGELVQLELTVTDGQLAIWRLKLYPLQYDPMNQTVFRHDGFTIRIDFGSAFQSLQNVTRIPSYLLNTELLLGASSPLRAAKLATLDANPFTEGTWYKITVSETGFYKISGAELAEVGFPTGSVLSDWIHMFYGGGRPLSFEPAIPTTDTFRRIAIELEDGGDGTFDSSDTIVFYGEALSRYDISAGAHKPIWQNYPYADVGRNVYWLKIQGGTIPKYVQTTGDIPSPSLTSITTFREHLHIEPENYIEYVDQFSAESGTEWYWEIINTQERTFTFNAPDLSSNPEAELGIGFRNGMYVAEGELDQYSSNHSVFYTLNDNIFNVISKFDTKTGETTQENISIPNVKSAQNTISMYKSYTGHDENEHVRLDWFEFEYNRNLSISNSNLHFFCEGTGSPQKYSISNVNSDIYDIYDTSDPYSVRKIGNTIFDGPDHILTFQATTAAGAWTSYTVVKRNTLKHPESIISKRQSNLRSSLNTADYLLITPEVFADEADKLVQWRAMDSTVDPITPMKVLVEDIFDEFSWGVYDPVAIRDFLHYATMSYNKGTKPIQYACLLGDTTYKFKNIANQTETNYIPSFTGFLDFKTSDYSVTRLINFSDDFYTWFDDNQIMEISIGRICATDRESAELVIAKTISYEQNGVPGYWHNRLLLVADDETQDGQQKPADTYTRDIETIDVGNSVSYIPDTFERVKLFMIEYPLVSKRKPSVTTELFKQLNEGCLVFNYIGHGNNDVLSHEHILRGSRDMDKFQNGGRQSLFLAFSCTVGKFDTPGIQSLAESLHMEPSGGSIASIAASRFTYNYKNVPLNKSFYTKLFFSDDNPDFRIGKALLLSKQDIGVDYPHNTSKYFLFGDPATRLAVPRYDITTTAIDTLHRLDRPQFETVLAPDDIISGPTTVLVKAFGPPTHKTYSFLNTTLYYTSQDTKFYDAIATAEESNYDFSFVVPKDIESDINRETSQQGESKIILYAIGSDFESSGVITDFILGDIKTDAPADVSGPSFELSFDQKQFSPGDVIRRQPELTLTLEDPSGINIVGKRGHNITLLIDGADPVVLTDQFSFIDGYTTGTATYQLPILDAGEHEFEITAYDTYNNAAKSTVTAQVAGSLTGDIAINDLLNYPNPMSDNGTTFTFTLTDYANHASIKIYSQAGRIVDTVTFIADYGFNQIPWHPPVDLANGVYFYKLSVTATNGRKSSKIEKLVVMK